MATTTDFKTYERGVRYQTTQTMFTSGMYFSDMPIPESAAKVLVNYDVHTDGMSMTPRRGLQTTCLSYPDSDNLYGTKVPEILTSKVCYQNDKEYIQIIAKEPLDNAEGYSISVYTIDNTALTKDTPLKHNVYKEALGYHDSSNQIKAVFTKAATNYTIHGMECENKQQHVGCFVNDQYFFFDENTKTLAYTLFDPDANKYRIHTLKPREVPSATAQQLGHNMLLKNPYTYADTYLDGDSNVDTITIHAMHPYEDEACEIPAQELIENQLYYYKINYSGRGTLKLRFDWTPTNAIDWALLEERTIEIADGNPPSIVIPFQAAASKAMLRCTAFRDVSVNGGVTEEPVEVMWSSFEYSATQTQAIKKSVIYSLYTATTMTYWQNRLVVAGVKEDKSYLFMSAPELFEYFPFTQNADYLDEPIVSVQAFLDNLLVFTKSKLYLYTLDPNYGITRKCIQTNLNITEEETHLIKIVKNMAYFKSGNYYYMVVPKLNSATGDLTIAPIYRYVKDLFDNFSEEVYNILQEVCGITEKIPLAYVHNYLDYEAVHNVYMFKVKEGLYINFDLLYNTVKRAWSIYIYETSSQMHVYKQDATKPGSMLCLSFEKTVFTTQINTRIEKYKAVFQLIDWAKDCKDTHFPYMWVSGKVLNNTVEYPNKQYIDTGLIELNSNYKKRFREIQFRVANTSKQTLNFTTTFYIDGETRTPEFVYTPVIDNATGTIVLNQVLTSIRPANTSVAGVTKLGAWELSKDVFPSRDVTKIRVPVSGKGYNSQIKISCEDQEDYALLDISNVYRQLYSR